MPCQNWTIPQGPGNWLFDTTNVIRCLSFQNRRTIRLYDRQAKIRQPVAFFWACTKYQATNLKVEKSSFIKNSEILTIDVTAAWVHEPLGRNETVYRGTRCSEDKIKVLLTTEQKLFWRIQTRQQPFKDLSFMKHPQTLHYAAKNRRIDARMKLPSIMHLDDTGVFQEKE